MGAFTDTSVVSIIIYVIYLGHTDCTNLSRKKTVNSSSIFHDTWVPSRIVDGDTRTDASTCGCCAATHSQLNPWYELDLGKHYNVRRVYIKGRKDTQYGQHFQNLQILFNSIHGDWDNPEKTELRPVYTVDYSPNVPKSTRYVSLVLRNVTRPFTVCEMTVYGECDDGEFGSYCQQTCHCDGDPCNKTSGICPTGQCLAGYEGKACDKECRNGKYGAGCTNTCGHCYGTDICNKTTGECPGKCSPGYQKRRCRTDCSDGSYGQDCARVCGQCRDNKPCEVTTGRCLDGCGAGYQTIYCNQECNRGSYGIECKGICGHCKDGVPCVVTNGTCPSGCTAGYQGHTCKTGCNHGFYGENCKLKCGSCSKNESCSSTKGYCAKGCMPGFVGDYCNKTCDNGYYGDGCITRCGNCAQNAICNKIHGECTDGCMNGYKSPLCKEECDEGMYGKNCVEKCGHCLNNTACNKRNGTCPACDPGYGGHACTIPLQKDDDDEDGPPTLLIGGAVGGIVVLALVVMVLIVFLKRRQSPTSEEKSSIPVELHREEVNASVGNAAVTSAVPVHVKAWAPLPNVESNATYDNQDYYGFITKKQELRVCQLWDYIYRKKKDGCVLLHQEFTLLKTGLIHPCVIAELKANKPKNRYRNLCAYDHCRVPLEAEEGESEYINASFINGVNKDKRFIASQGPTLAMRDDFWRMVWQQKSQQIVMVTNLVEMGTDKCLIYWPESEDVTYGKITIRLDSEKIEPDFVVRSLRIRKNEEGWRRVTQYHFRAWPDKDVPDSTWSLVKFWLAVTSDETYGQYPIVVHCSAGIGRTGTFIALDNAYNQAKTEGVLNVLGIVTALREQRVNMVQTKEQYVFLHEAVADALLFGTHYIWSNQFEDVYKYLTAEVGGIKQRRLKEQYNLIVESIEDRKQVHVQRDADIENESEYSNVFVTKTLSSSAVALDDYMPKSHNMDGVRELGVVFLPNYDEKNTFLISKSPTGSTMEAFWSVIAEQNVKTVVMLTDKSSTRYKITPSVLKSSSRIRPRGLHRQIIDANLRQMHKTRSCLTTPPLGRTKTMKELCASDKSIQGKFSLSIGEAKTTDVLVETAITYTYNGKTATVHQFELNSWPKGDVIPKDTLSMLNFLEAVLDWQQRLDSTQPQLVHCSNGSERSGLLCVLLNELERMKREQGHTNIVQSVKLMKERNENIIPNCEQYMYVYDAVLSTFAKGEVYANC